MTFSNDLILHRLAWFWLRRSTVFLTLKYGVPYVPVREVSFVVRDSLLWSAGGTVRLVFQA